MPDFNHAPIDRHESLAPFSRDHYRGLVVARHLIQSTDADREPGDRRAALLEFEEAWRDEIAEHFDDEERLLTGRLSGNDRKRLLTEHETLRALAERSTRLRDEADPDPVLVRQMGETLRRHIRWEERELFSRLQDQLSAEQLKALQQHTAIIEKQRPRDAHGRR